MIGDFQRPPEVFERVLRGSGDQILNQQWDEPPHIQPPMIPTTAPMPQAQYTTTNTTSHKVEVSAERQQANLPKERLWDRAEKASTLMTNRQVETLRENSQESQFFNVQGNVSTPTGHRRPKQINGKQCPGWRQLTKETLGQESQPTAIRRRSSHTGCEESITNEVKSDCETTGGNKRSPQECKVMRVLPDEELDFMDLVRDSVSAQAKNGPKPMFVNNYFVGDNNWRATARETPDER